MCRRPGMRAGRCGGRPIGARARAGCWAGRDVELVQALRGLDEDNVDGPNAVMSAMKAKLGGSD
ncbi:MAG TPA: hypothetical protein VI357_02410 [Mycobacteriales bacterium]